MTKIGAVHVNRRILFNDCLWAWAGAVVSNCRHKSISNFYGFGVVTGYKKNGRSGKKLINAAECNEWAAMTSKGGFYRISPPCN